MSAVASPTPLHQIQFRLAYADCDPAGIVYYAAYFGWMERLSTEWWLSQGIRLDQMLERFGASFVVRASGCEYPERAALFDPLEARLFLHDIGRTSFTLRGSFVRTSDGVEVARVTSTLAMIDAAGASTPVPSGLRAVLESSAATASTAAAPTDGGQVPGS